MAHFFSGAYVNARNNYTRTLTRIAELNALQTSTLEKIQDAETRLANAPSPRAKIMPTRIIEFSRATLDAITAELSELHDLLDEIREHYSENRALYAKAGVTIS